MYFDYRAMKYLLLSTKHANEKMFGQYMNSRKAKLRGGWKRK